MIGRSARRGQIAEEASAKGFDAFELRLGDMMRGERATLGKSLLDVQRELKIKANYIAAIENCDPTAFDTPGFIAGYVRSYARYLGMEPDWAFDTFCHESGFATAHGMSEAASAVKPTREERMAAAGGMGRDIFNASTTPFIPAGERMFANLEARALGSIAVLAVLIAGLGYGGWSLLQEVQKVQFAPIEQAPAVVANIDPLAGATRAETPMLRSDELASVALPSAEALDRLYRPLALDVPVLTARDGPIAALSAQDTGAFAQGDSTLPPGLADLAAEAEMVASAAAVATDQPTPPTTVRVTEGPAPEVMLIAVRPAWVRVSAASGTVIFEGILDSGDSYVLPALEDPAKLRVGASGALYFAINGTPYGPAGEDGAVTSDLELSPTHLTATYAVADLDADSDLAEFVRVAENLVGQ